MKKLSTTISVLVIIVMLFSLSGCGEPSSEDADKEEKEVRTTEKVLPEIKGQVKDIKDSSLIPVKRADGLSSELYGYADEDGNLVIKPQYKSAELFYTCGVAIVSDKNSKYGIINKKGEYLVKPEYSYFWYSDGLFITYNDQTNTTIAFDGVGNKCFELKGSVGDFGDGLASYIGETQKGYIDKRGNLKIKLEYDQLGVFSNGLAEVAKDYSGPLHLIDTTGADVASKVSSGLKVFIEENESLYGYKNNSGDVVIKAQFVEAQPFYNGYAIVKITEGYFDKYGIINDKGEYALKPVYSGIRRLRNKLFAVGEEVDDNYNPPMYSLYCKNALFSWDLKNHTEWKYYNITDFDNENVCVNDDSSIMFIDSSLNKAEGLPVIKGYGYFEKDEMLLRGLCNTFPTVMDSNGSILVQDISKTDIGGGMMAVAQAEYLNRNEVVKYPVISGMKDKERQKEINNLIKEKMLSEIKGKNENEGDINICNTGYSISLKKNLMVITCNSDSYMIGAAHGSYTWYTINIDISTAKEYAIKELFKQGNDVYKYLGDAVNKKIKQGNDEFAYYDDNVEITPDTKLALADDGIIIYFELYEIAPYATGMPEFFIPYADLTDYIDKQSELWKSFN